MSINALCYIWNIFGVMVFQRSMLNWRRGWGQSAIGICALCYTYMKLIWCNGFPEIYAQLEEGVGGWSAMDICALCYIWNLFGVTIFQISMLNWRGWGQSAIQICAFCYIYVTNTNLYLPQVHWGYYQTLLWSLLAMLRLGDRHINATWGLSMLPLVPKW